MTDIQQALKGFAWLQTTQDKEAGISAFYRRFGKAPNVVLESTIGHVTCWYLGPIPTIEKGESNDGTITRQKKA